MTQRSLSTVNMAALPEVKSVSLEDIVCECGLVTKERLQESCMRQFVLTIAHKFEDWKTLGYHLGVPSEELKAIGCDNDTESQRMTGMFNVWYEREDSGATYWRLAEALHRWGRRDLVEMLCTRLYKYDELSKEWSSHIRAYWTPERCAAAEPAEMPNYQPSPSPQPSDGDNQEADIAYNRPDTDCTSERAKLEGPLSECVTDAEQTPMTAEYHAFLRHIQDIELLIKSHIVVIGGELLSSKLITHSQYEETRERLELRAADLVGYLQTRVQQDHNHYHTFLDVLKRDPERYGGVLKKLKDTYESFKFVAAHQPAVESDTPAPPATEGNIILYFKNWHKNHSTMFIPFT